MTSKPRGEHLDDRSESIMRIALASWSLKDRFRHADRPLSLLEFPRLAREEFDIGLVELNSVFFEFEEPADPGSSPVRTHFVKELAAAVHRAGVEVVCVTIDHHGDLSSVDEEARRVAVEQHLKWLPICEALGCRLMRANSGGRGEGRITEAHAGQCTRSFAALAEAGGRVGVTVLMENHWGVSEDPQRMTAVLSAVDSPYCGALADFRNFAPGLDPVEGLRILAPYARYAHAKFLRFDESGEDPEFDTRGAIRVLRSAGYDGPWGIEYEGTGDDAEGVRLSKTLLLRHGRAG